MQHSSNCCALMHSGKTPSLALPEIDPFLLSLWIQMRVPQMPSTHSTDKIIFRTWKLIKLLNWGEVVAFKTEPDVCRVVLMSKIKRNTAAGDLTLLLIQANQAKENVCPEQLRAGGGRVRMELMQVCPLLFTQCNYRAHLRLLLTKSSQWNTYIQELITRGAQEVQKKVIFVGKIVI